MGDLKIDHIKCREYLIQDPKVSNSYRAHISFNCLPTIHKHGKQNMTVRHSAILEEHLAQNWLGTVKATHREPPTGSTRSLTRHRYPYDSEYLSHPFPECEPLEVVLRRVHESVRDV
jgi:hypothetical protein